MDGQRSCCVAQRDRVPKVSTGWQRERERRAESVAHTRGAVDLDGKGGYVARLIADSEYSTKLAEPHYGRSPYQRP